MFFFNYSFYICFLVLYVLLSTLCVLCFFFGIVLCIVSPHVYYYFLYLYKYIDHCYRPETQLQLMNII